MVIPDVTRDLHFSSPFVFVPALAIAAWYVVVAAIAAARHPPRPPARPATMELGPEPPAVANLLVNDFTVTNEAVPATLLDLAARDVVEIEEVAPGRTIVRVGHARGDGLTLYERRVFNHVRCLAVDGVVPADALTTGPEDDSAT